MGWRPQPLRWHRAGRRLARGCAPPHGRAGKVAAREGGRETSVPGAAGDVAAAAAAAVVVADDVDAAVAAA